MKDPGGIRARFAPPAFDIALALVWYKAFSDNRAFPHLEQGWLTNHAEELNEAGVELGLAWPS